MRLLETLEKRRLVGKKKRLVEEEKEGGNLSHRNKLVEKNPPLGFSIALVVGVAVDAIKELVVVEIKQEPLKRRRWMQRRRCEREMVAVWGGGRCRCIRTVQYFATTVSKMV